MVEVKGSPPQAKVEGIIKWSVVCVIDALLELNGEIICVSF